MANTFKLHTDAEMTQLPPQDCAVLFYGYTTGEITGRPTLRVMLPDGTFVAVATQDKVDSAINTAVGDINQVLDRINGEVL